MPTMIRLSRHGKTHKAFYHIVIADGRAPRDGRFIEKIGTYDPVANPAEIVLDFDKALDWLQKGAQPTDTVKTILSYKGVLYKHHLLKGVKKGAFNETEAEVKFQNWLSEKEAKIAAKRSGVDEKVRAEQKARLDAEVKVNEERAAEIAKKKTAEIDAKVKAAKEAAAEKAAKEDAEAAEKKAEIIETPEAVEKKAEIVEPPKEEPKAEVKEEPKAEVKEEPKAEIKEEPKAEIKKEPKAEIKEEPKAEIKEEPKAEVKEEPKAEEETKTEE